MSERQHDLDETDPVSPFSATDMQWWLETGMCGGCGSAQCHVGPCDPDLCRWCPNRIAEGWFRWGTRA